ncbi:GIY-YIG nuclease family protein [uncultured Carboxylicivirga sp.]|uniref:GIY-YIG nuclease family protein n=1 Tax=uncultured Carboxylicivirga sp. TaxID=1628156 RepID=UPI0026212B34|nr:GIY-YIG nuclease family protein [uncultured Carboxylicivirga sp.]
MEFFIYILYSPSSNKYYIGYSKDPNKRLKEHNSYQDKSKFTAKHQPWDLKAYFSVSDNAGNAMRVERFIKKQKSRRFIRDIIINQQSSDYLHSIIKKALS